MMKRLLYSFACLMAMATGAWAQSSTVDSCVDSEVSQAGAWNGLGGVFSKPGRTLLTTSGATSLFGDKVLEFSCTSAGQPAVCTDGTYIYTASWQASPNGGYTFYKYDLDGNFVEGFDIDGVTQIRDITSDGTYFYASVNNNVVYQLNLTTKTLVGTLSFTGATVRHLSYDPKRDGFWAGDWSRLALYDRSGNKIQDGPNLNSAFGSSYFVDTEGNEHLLLFCQPNSNCLVYDYNITDNTLSTDPILDLNIGGMAGGSFISTYKGNLCWFGNSQQDPNIVEIYKLNAGITDIGASTAAIDLDVPDNLGENGGATDLATFLDSYLQNSPNPAYIKLTLKAGGQYTISKPIETITAIQILGDENEPATIDAGALTDALVKINDAQVSGTPNDKGFYNNIYNVEFKNLIIDHARGKLFSSNGQKYVIPYFTVDNVLFSGRGSHETLVDFTNGGVVENLTMTNSTTYSFGDLYSAAGGSTLEAAGVNSQQFTLSHNTFIVTSNLIHASAADSKARTITVDHNVVMENAATFVTGLNAGDANCIVQYNAFQTETHITEANGNYVFADVSDGEDTAGAAGSIKGAMVWVGYTKLFEDLNEGISNFPLADCPQKDAKIGDPRWLAAKMRVKASDLDDSGDLAAVINKGVQKGYTEFELVQNAYGNAHYTVKQPIVTDKALSITGSNVKIDVEHSDAFILLSKTPAVDLINDYYRMDAITLKGLTVTGLKNSIIYDNNTKYCVVDLTIDDCVLGLETVATKNQAFISFQQGGVKDFTMKNSTVYQAGAEENNYFLRYNNSARLDRYGYDKNVETQSINYINNTFYKVGKNGQWGNYNGIAGQAYSEFHVTGNIWVDCGNGQIARRLLGGRNASSYKTCEFNNNTYWFNGAAETGNTSYDEGNQLTTDPGFKKPAEANFTLSAYSEQATEKTGDPRWNAEPHYNTAIEGVAAEKADDGAWYTIQGVRVDKPAKGLYIHNGRKVVIK